MIAATGAFSALGLLSAPMTVAIPITRVGGFIWSIAAELTLRASLASPSTIGVRHANSM